MPFPLALGLAHLLLAVPTAATEVKFTVPNTAVEVTLEIPEYRDGELPIDPQRGLLAGKLLRDGNISILHEENFPYTTGRDWYERAWKSKPGAQYFAVGSIACFQWEDKLPAGFSQKHLYAFPTTTDELFTIHVSGVHQSGETGSTVSRAEFEKIVASFRTSGRTDPDTLTWPRAVYEFRDLAAQHERDQLAWVKSQAKAEPDAWATHYYLGVLAKYLDDTALAVAGYARAADVLQARADRTEKETGALLDALSDVAFLHGSKSRKFREAQPFVERILAVTKDAGDERSKRYRSSAFFSLAICQARTNRADDAMKSLRSAVELDPKYREAASDNELLEPLRKRKDFQALVKP